MSGIVPPCPTAYCSATTQTHNIISSRLTRYIVLLHFESYLPHTLLHVNNYLPWDITYCSRSRTSVISVTPDAASLTSGCPVVSLLCVALKVRGSRDPSLRLEKAAPLGMTPIIRW